MEKVLRSLRGTTKASALMLSSTEKTNRVLFTIRREKTDHSEDNVPHPELASNVYFGSKISGTVDILFLVVYIWTLTFRIFDRLLLPYVTLRSHLHEAT